MSELPIIEMSYCNGCPNRCITINHQGEPCGDTRCNWQYIPYGEIYNVHYKQVSQIRKALQDIIEEQEGEE